MIPKFLDLPIFFVFLSIFSHLLIFLNCVGISSQRWFQSIGRTCRFHWLAQAFRSSRASPVSLSFTYYSSFYLSESFGYSLTKSFSLGRLEDTVTWENPIHSSFCKVSNLNVYIIFPIFSIFRSSQSFQSFDLFESCGYSLTKRFQLDGWRAPWDWKYRCFLQLPPVIFSMFSHLRHLSHRKASSYRCRAHL
jgi:hypothetical protein